MTIEIYVCNGRLSGANEIMPANDIRIDLLAREYKFIITEWISKSYKVYRLTSKEILCHAD